ncbi:B12-binding domain-containing radical SAM protein [Candidatus Gracilibacteria bacterium]|nr:B12-binding domain-containing radical SAM protein [Candidatus Gracilibacteria bacterium]
MIAAARAAGCAVIVCGADATDNAHAYLAAGAHYVLLGEGEATLIELLDWLESSSGFRRQDSGVRSAAAPLHIAGLAFLQDGQLVQTGRRPDLKDLDALPLPAWDLIDMAHYRALWRERHGYFALNVATTRGCPYHCNWCAKPIWGQRYNVRSPANVVAELKMLYTHYAPDEISFVDDILGIKPGWLRSFADLLAAEGLRISFKCLNRADLLLRPGIVEALRDAGCRIVWIGAESGSQAVLDAMEKGTTVEQIYTATQRLHQAGIAVGFFLQFGYPGETRSDIEHTLQMVRDCKPDDIGMSVSYPLPGTPFHERVRDQLGVTRNWQDSDDLAMLYCGPFSTAFYRQLHTVLHKEFRSSRPGRWQRQLYHRLTLPLARRRLNALARSDSVNQLSLSPALTLEEAARPTPQE